MMQIWNELVWQELKKDWKQLKISFQCNLELDELDFALMSAILVTSEKKRNRFTRTIKESLKSQHVSLNRFEPVMDLLATIMLKLKPTYLSKMKIVFRKYIAPYWKLNWKALQHKFQWMHSNGF